jgi:uncharacterized protein YceK
MKRKVTVCGLIIMVMLAGCASMTVGQPMTPKQQYTVAANTYNTVFDDTMAMAKTPNLTVAQKEMVVKKKAILSQMQPILLLVGNTLKAGGTPSPADLTTLNSLVNQLTTMASTGGK